MILVAVEPALDSKPVEPRAAHPALTLVAIGLAFVFTATAVIFYLFPVCRTMRRMLLPQPPADDSGQVQKSTKKRKTFQPKMTSTPLAQMRALPQRLNQPFHQLRSLPPQRSPTFFAASMPRPAVYPFPPPPNASHNSPTPGFYNYRISPPNQSYAANHHSRPQSALATLPPPPPTTLVSPHIAGWMKIADDVVGRHPFAKPLFARVATQAEIAFFSDRVPVRWAQADAHCDTIRSQPTPVMVLGPVHNRQGNRELKANAESNRGRFPLPRDQGLNRIDSEQHASPSPKTIRRQGQNKLVVQNHS